MESRWLFQASPSEDDLREFFKKKKAGDKFTWRATRFKDPHGRMHAGDGVVMWQTRGRHPEAAGVYALGRLTGRIVGSVGKWQAEVLLDRLRPLNRPITPEVLRLDSRSALIAVLKPKGAMGSNFRLDSAQWDAIQESWRVRSVDDVRGRRAPATRYFRQYGAANSIPNESEYSRYFIGSVGVNRKIGASRERFARYRVGMSLQEAIANGISRMDLRWDNTHGLITIVSKTPLTIARREDVPVPKLRPLDRYLTASTAVEPSEAYVQTQSERELVTAYAAHMKPKEYDFKIPEFRLRADMYEPSRKLLIEAKGAATRVNVRMAIGELADYMRFLRPKTLAVLLPERPSTDLEALLKSQKIQLIWRNADGRSFSDNARGTLS